VRRSDLDADPLAQFRRWYAEAEELVPVPEKIALATSSPEGAPSLRMVLLKGADENGLTFFSHYPSRKGRELEANPQAAILCYWEPLGRQVRAEGRVARLDPELSDAYFATRPRDAQVGAHASRQSEAIASRDELERRVAALDGELPAQVPRPAWWGGFRLVPETWEFWEHRDSRLHDRFRYARDGGGWRIDRLNP
jgi:pyridoxamine 5'-phosphate oxidase